MAETERRRDLLEEKAQEDGRIHLWWVRSGGRGSGPDHAADEQAQRAHPTILSLDSEVLRHLLSHRSATELPAIRDSAPFTSAPMVREV